MKQTCLDNADPIRRLARARRRARSVDDGDREIIPARRLTRQEQLEGLADRGCDTWEEYRGER